MNAIKRLTALTLALLCAAPVLMGCGKKEESIAEDEMPYGSTMREDKSTFAVPMTYDRRFLEEEQVAKVAELCAAVQNTDSTLYESATFPFYAQYQMDQVYSLDSMEALMERLHSGLASGTAEDFQFNMVLINDIDTNTEAGELAAVCQMLSAAYDGEGAFMDTVEQAYDLTVEWNIGYEDNTQFSTVNEQHIYLFQTADGWSALM